MYDAENRTNTAFPRNNYFRISGKCNGEEAKFPTGLVTIDSNQYKLSSDNAAVYIGTVKIAVTNKAGVRYDVPVVINTTFTKEA